MAKVSIIVPVYNTERYLEKCLSSLVNQTLEEIEIIVINDGSTDGSADIIEFFVQDYPTKIRVISKENGGQGLARNLGIQASRGEYIGFIDSDDYAELNMYEIMYSTAVEQDADMVICDYYNVIGEERKIVSLKHQSNEELLVDPKVAPWNKLYRASTVKVAGVNFREGLIYEDTAFYANMIPFIRKHVNVNTPLLYHLDYRKGATTSIASAERYAQMFEIMDGIVTFYAENGFLERYADSLEYFYSKVMLGSNFQRMATLPEREKRHQFLRLSYTMVSDKFPDYAKNKYYHGRMIGVYMRVLNKTTIVLIGDLCFLINKLKGK